MNLAKAPLKKSTSIIVLESSEKIRLEEPRLIKKGIATQGTNVNDTHSCKKPSSPDASLPPVDSRASTNEKPTRAEVEA